MNYNFFKYFGVVHGEMRRHGWWNSFLHILVWPIWYPHQICPIELTVNGFVPFLNEPILMWLINPTPCNMWSRFASSGPGTSPSLLFSDSSTRPKEASCTANQAFQMPPKENSESLSTAGMEGGVWTFSLAQEEECGLLRASSTSPTQKFLQKVLPPQWPSRTRSALEALGHSPMPIIKTK